MFKRTGNVSIEMLYQRILTFYRQNMKLGFVSNGNRTILPVDLCCMKFRHRLKIPKKQTCMPKQNNVGAKPVHRNGLSKHKLFCYGLFKTHGTFGCDLQNRFEENAKIMRYCSAKRSFLTCSVMGRVG